MKVSHLFESRSGIVSLGFPEIIARLFTTKFGKFAFLFAKWYKDYTNYVNKDRATWFEYAHNTETKNTINKLIYLYNHSDSKETYNIARKHLELYVDQDEWFDSTEIKSSIIKHLTQEFFEKPFFRSILLNDIISGKIKDLSSYKKLDYYKALNKYENIRVFEKTTPLKIYPNGFKWIDVGPQCTFVGSQMKNCGSVGVMGTDPDRTILCLFDKNNKPHVMVTYQPNEKEIKSEEGAASSIIKAEYAPFVVDLANTLNAAITNPKSKYLKLLWLFRNSQAKITILKEDVYNNVYKIVVRSHIMYSDSYKVANHDDVKKFYNYLKLNPTDEIIGLSSKKLPNLLDAMFNFRNGWKMKELNINLRTINEVADLYNK